MVDKLKQSMERMQKNIDSNVVQLPFWADNLRSSPNEIVRSQLFTARHKSKTREQYKEKELLVIGDGQLFYTGEELRTDDEDLWLEILDLSKSLTLNDEITFTAHAMLKRLGRVASGANYKRLMASLDRLKWGGFSVNSKRLNKTVKINLISRLEIDEPDSANRAKIKITLDREIRSLFKTNYITGIDREIRQQLSPIGKRLHAYYASHAEPHAIKLDTAKDLCKLEIESRTKLRQTIRKALSELVEVGFLEYGHVKDDKLFVGRSKPKSNVPKDTNVES